MKKIILILFITILSCGVKDLSPNSAYVTNKTIVVKVYNSEYIRLKGVRKVLYAPRHKVTRGDSVLVRYIYDNDTKKLVTLTIEKK